MKSLNSKLIRQLLSDIEKIEMGLNETVSTDRFDDYANVAIGIAEVIEGAGVSEGIVERVKELKAKGLREMKKRHYLSKMYVLLKPKVEYLRQKEERDNPPKNELLYSFEDKGFRNSSIERLEALKLQLQLATQKGFYLLQKEKSKVKAQEDILIIAAQIIQELAYEDSLVQQVISKFQSIKDYETVSYVTDTEEQVIESCYVLLFEKLLDLNYR